MDLSFWEINEWIKDIDYVIVGSGIVGINCALQLRKNFPESKIIILEKGILPQGASTKNAGFACFGSISEILDDLKSHSENEVFKLVQKRWKGLKKLREIVGDVGLDFQENGGIELFLENEEALFTECEKNIPRINKLLFPIFNSDVFQVVETPNNFSKTTSKIIVNKLEGQIDTGKMMSSFLKLTTLQDIKIINQTEVISYLDYEENVEIETNNFTFKSKKIFFATNGFSEKLVTSDVIPARAQVLITEPIENLNIKGTFHIEKGYYYFRNFNNRIILGGGRNLDFEGETTTEFGITEKIQNKLENLLKEVILPNQDFKIAHRWSGIMGMGKTKNPIVKQLSDNVFCGIRLGGMGIAIGTLIGQQLADLLNGNKN
ncbi:MAG: glycine/D-amino acid oxidase-like deaminating enzyme [Flavobacterium sp.]|jgi:glycine/D-amino acid oxidase-like deaminating enzyme